MCKPFDYSPFIGRQRFSSFVVWHVIWCEIRLVASPSAAKLMQKYANYDRNSHLAHGFYFLLPLLCLPLHQGLIIRI